MMKDEIVLSEVITYCGAIKYIKPGILIFVPNSFRMGQEDFINVAAEFSKLTSGKKVPYLFDTRQKHEPMDSGVKKYLSENLYKFVSCVGVVENSALTRFLAHTFISVYRPKIPIKLFKNYKEALIWLKSEV